MKTISKEQMEDWKDAGYNYKEIAVAAGVCVSAVRNYMVKYGLAHFRELTKEEKDLFCRMKKEGKSTEEISMATGRSVSAVYKTLKAAGLIDQKIAKVPKKEENDTFTPRVIRYAEKRKPKAVRIIAGGKSWLDVSDFWIPK